MSDSADSCVHEAQQPQRSPGFVEGGFVKRGCVEAAVGGPCGAVCSAVTILISGAPSNAPLELAMVATETIALGGAGVGVIFGAALLALLGGPGGSPGAMQRNPFEPRSLETQG
jgi:hypothetical protein